MRKVLLENLKLLNQSTRFFAKRYNFYHPNIKINDNMEVGEITSSFRKLSHFIKHPELSYLVKNSKSKSPT